MELLNIIEKISNEIIKNKDYLTELDREIGDGDHGVNLSRGFEKILEELPKLEGQKPADIFMKMTMLLMSNVGGASGALYSTALMKGAAVLKKYDSITPNVIIEVWDEMIKGIQMRGKAVLGEKTMLDTQIPAFEELKKEIAEGKTLNESFLLASEKAKEGMEATKDIIATKGRASYLGERSIGHIDPGSASSYIIIKTISDQLNK